MGKTSVVNTALTRGELTCPQGVCLCWSEARNEFYLLCRDDQKEVGLRLFEELKTHYSDRRKEDFPRIQAELDEKGIAPAARELSHYGHASSKPTASDAISLPASRTVFER